MWCLKEHIIQRRSSVFIINFEQISHFALLLPLLSLKK